MSKLKQPLDLLAFDCDLTAEQVAVRDRVRTWCSESVSPLINDAWRDCKFPFSLTTQMGELGCFGTTIDGYGCPGRSPIVSGLIMRELERCDSGLRTMASVQSALSMNAIHDFGSEEQKSHWLPAMAKGELLGCFALTEPGFGSNPAGLQTRAKRDGTGWILSGEKQWIGNALSASVAIVWAKLGDEDDARNIRGFLVETDSAGYSASVIDNKYSLRIAETCAMQLDDVRVGAESLLPGTECGLRATLSCLNHARFGIAWGVLGAAEACLQEASDYLSHRMVFDRPLDSYQLVQEKLAVMASRLTQAQAVAVRLAVLKANGTLQPEQISFAKAANVEAAQSIARTARELLGANGIIDDFNAMRHMCNLESVATYEGTRDVHRLVLGQALTGTSAFR